MSKYKLAVLVIGRNEMFLNRTIQDILEHKCPETEIIVGLDEVWDDIPIHPDVTVYYTPVNIGQRAITNQICKLTEAKYVMKLDSHCSVAQGFDLEMFKCFEELGDNITAVPLMRNLHAFNWLCKNDHRRYQGPSGPCTECGEPTEREMIWKGKDSPRSTSYLFSTEPKFDYFGEYKPIQDATGSDYVESMSLQGSCFMLTREKYWELDICDESFGSWGSQGIEVAVKTWLSGGRVICNKKTHYSHMFRTQGGDFGFPYKQHQSTVEKAKKTARELFFDNRWEGQILPLSWLVEKFNPPERSWSKEAREKLKTWPLRNQNRIYYTCNSHADGIEQACRRQLLKTNLKCVSVSLNKSIDFGDIRIVYKGEKGLLAMHKQILTGLQASKARVVFLCENDVLYHESHFDFIPPDMNTFYYNTNVWRFIGSEEKFIWTDDMRQLSGICASRELLIEHFTKKIQQIEIEGFDRHYEPGCRQSFNTHPVENWKSRRPNICIRHDSNLTKTKTAPDEYRNKKYAKGWKESNEVGGWGTAKDILNLLQWE